MRPGFGPRAGRGLTLQASVQRKHSARPRGLACSTRRAVGLRGVTYHNAVVPHLTSWAGTIVRLTGGVSRRIARRGVLTTNLSIRAVVGSIAKKTVLGGRSTRRMDAPTRASARRAALTCRAFGGPAGDESRNAHGVEVLALPAGASVCACGLRHGRRRGHRHPRPVARGFADREGGCSGWFPIGRGGTEVDRGAGTLLGRT